jgi:hypothetical protein
MSFQILSSNKGLQVIIQSFVLLIGRKLRGKVVAPCRIEPCLFRTVEVCYRSLQNASRRHFSQEQLSPATFSVVGVSFHSPTLSMNTLSATRFLTQLAEPYYQA